MMKDKTTRLLHKTHKDSFGYRVWARQNSSNTWDSVSWRNQLEIILKPLFEEKNGLCHMYIFVICRPRSLLRNSSIKMWPNCSLSSLKVSSISLTMIICNLKVAAFFFLSSVRCKYIFPTSVVLPVLYIRPRPNTIKQIESCIPSCLAFIWSWNFNEMVTKTRCFCIILGHFDFGLDFPHSVTSTEEQPTYNSSW